MRNKLIVNLYKIENKKLNWINQVSENLPDEIPNIGILNFINNLLQSIYKNYGIVKPSECSIEFYHEHWEKNEGDFNEIHHMKVKGYDKGIDELVGYLMKLYVK